MLSSRDPFEILPVELRLAIITYLPDLPTLHRLTFASTILLGTCEENSVECVSAVIRSMTADLQQIIRTVTIALTNISTDTNDIDSNVLLKGKVDEEGGHIETNEESSIRLPSTLTPKQIRSLLHLSSQIQIIGQSFLETHLHRINSIEAQHLPEGALAFRRDMVFQNYPQGIAYTPQTTRSISWVEKYRVERGLWRLQLHAILTPRQTEVRPFDSTQYPTGTFRSPQLARIYPASIYRAFEGWELDEMQCVQDHMNEHRLSLQVPVSAELEYPNPLPTQRKATIPSESPKETPQWPVLSDPPTDAIPHAWYQDASAAERPTEPYRMFAAYGTNSPSSPLQGVDWAIFRRLGFGIWDLKRMGTMELFTVHQRQVSGDEGERIRCGAGDNMGLNNILFTWRSIKLDGKRIVADGP